MWKCLIIAISLVLQLDAATLKNVELHDTISTWQPPKEFWSMFPYYVSGFDLESRPVFIIQFGKWKVKPLVEKGGKDYLAYRKYVEQMFYRMENGATLYGNDTNTKDVGCILDAEGFSMEQAIHPRTIQQFVHDSSKFQTIQQNVAYLIYINVDSVAQRLLQLYRPLLGSVTERLEVYGTYKHKWMPMLMRKIGADQLPPAYGGIRPDYQPVATFG